MTGNTLANDLKCRDLFHSTSEYFGEKAKSIIEKGVYPLFYMNSFEKFAKTSYHQRPYTPLIRSDEKQISSSEYKYAFKAWNTFELKQIEYIYTKI